MRRILGCLMLLAVFSCARAENVPLVSRTPLSAIAAQPLKDALILFGRASGLQLIYESDFAQGQKTRGAPAGLRPIESLKRLLEGTGLTYQVVNERTISIHALKPTADIAQGPGVHLAQTEAQSMQEVDPSRRSGEGARGADEDGFSSRDEDPANMPEKKPIDELVITGTRIRGSGTPSPVITIGSERIREEGFTNLGEVIRSIPQNFSGGQNPGVVIGLQATSNDQNITGGSGLNLRGLGPDATLTLLNGRRMSYGGFSQAVDVSAIPVEAVERLEIVPDGASAIYGSDAVGGVANIILKRDFNGVTAGARYGSATEGGLTTRAYTATAGTTWDTGGMILAGEKDSNDPIYSDQRNYTRSMYRPSTLWQGSDLRSGLFSLHQSLGEAVGLQLDATRSQRDTSTALAYASAYYPYTVGAKTTLLAPSLEVRLPGDWTLTVGGAVGKETDSVAQSVTSRADDTIIAGELVTYRNKSLTYEAGAEGPLFMLPGGAARLAAGAGYRENNFLSVTNNVADADGSQDSRFAYAELRLPLVDRLAMTGALRAEDGDYGKVTTPKFGVIYSPSADFSLKSSWGKSFKAPTLLDRYFQNGVSYYPAGSLGTGYPADATVLFLYGGNPDLRPERAQTWSASLAFHPQALSGLEAQLTWFDIDYRERVLAPINSYDVLGNPVYADFVHYDPAEAAQAAVIAAVSSFNNLVGAPYDASKVVAIIDSRSANISRQHIKGIDLSGAYRADVGGGQVVFRGSVSWLDSTQATSATQSPYDMAGTLSHPAKISGRIGALWNVGGFGASLFGNYRSGVKNIADGSDGASFTTFDGVVRYETGGEVGALAGMAFELAAQNLFDRAPPLYAAPSLTYAPYDSTNYSAVGRFLSFSVSKHF